MKFETTPAFDADVRRLSKKEQRSFRQVVADRFIPACEARANDPSHPWPKSLRVKRVEGAEGIWEMTWSFSGPDGRATFAWITRSGEPHLRWHRVGGHAIFKDPKR